MARVQQAERALKEPAPTSSVRAYAVAVIQGWYELGLSALFTILGAASALSSVSFPRWVWFAGAVVSFIASPYRAFTRQRAELQETRAQLAEARQAARTQRHVVEHRQDNAFESINDRMKSMERQWAATARREREIVRRLHAEYVATHDDVPVAVRVGTAPLPKEWVEQRLTELGEEFRWKAYKLPIPEGPPHD